MATVDVHVGLTEAGQKEIIRALLQTYLEELTLLPGEVAEYRDAAGQFHYPYLDAYWIEDQRFPYLIRTDEAVAGFALIRLAKLGLWEVAEFYIKPEFRRMGIGELAALCIIQHHPGNWRISFNKHNYAGVRLWTTIAPKLATGEVSHGDVGADHAWVGFSSQG
jgi:predicted acetyltransferase